MRTETVDGISFRTVVINDVKDAYSFSALLLQSSIQVDQDLVLEVGDVEGFEEGETLGRDGWKVLAETLEKKPNLVRELMTSKREMEEADWEDIETIWEAIGEDGFLLDNFEQFEKNEEGAWVRVERILKMAKDTWAFIRNNYSPLQ